MQSALNYSKVRKVRCSNVRYCQRNSLSKLLNIGYNDNKLKINFFTYYLILHANAK